MENDVFKNIYDKSLEESKNTSKDSQIKNMEELQPGEETNTPVQETNETEDKIPEGFDFKVGKYVKNKGYVRDSKKYDATYKDIMNDQEELNKLRIKKPGEYINRLTTLVPALVSGNPKDYSGENGYAKTLLNTSLTLRNDVAEQANGTPEIWNNLSKEEQQKIVDILEKNGYEYIVPVGEKAAVAQTAVAPAKKAPSKDPSGNASNAMAAPKGTGAAAKENTNKKNNVESSLNKTPKTKALNETFDDNFFSDENVQKAIDNLKEKGITANGKTEEETVAEVKKRIEQINKGNILDTTNDDKKLWDEKFKDLNSMSDEDLTDAFNELFDKETTFNGLLQYFARNKGLGIIGTAKLLFNHPSKWLGEKQVDGSYKLGPYTSSFLIGSGVANVSDIVKALENAEPNQPEPEPEPEPEPPKRTVSKEDIEKPYNYTPEKKEGWKYYVYGNGGGTTKDVPNELSKQKERVRELESNLENADVRADLLNTGKGVVKAVKEGKKLVDDLTAKKDEVVKANATKAEKQKSVDDATAKVNEAEANLNKAKTNLDAVKNATYEDEKSKKAAIKEAEKAVKNAQKEADKTNKSLSVATEELTKATNDYDSLVKENGDETAIDKLIADANVVLDKANENKNAFFEEYKLNPDDFEERDGTPADGSDRTTLLKKKSKVDEELDQIASNQNELSKLEKIINDANSAKANKAEKVKLESEFLKDKYPDIYKWVFGKYSGANLGQRLAGLGEILASIVANANLGANAGLNKRAYENPVVGRNAKLFNKAAEKQVDREQSQLDEEQKVLNERQNRKTRIETAPGFEDMDDDTINELASYERTSDLDENTFKAIIKQDWIRKYADDYGMNPETNEKLDDYISKKIENFNPATYYSNLYQHYQNTNNTDKEGLEDRGTVYDIESKRLANKEKHFENVKEKNEYINLLYDKLNELEQLKGSLVWEGADKSLSLMATYIGSYKGLKTLTNSSTNNISKTFTSGKTDDFKVHTGANGEIKLFKVVDGKLEISSDGGTTWQYQDVQNYLDGKTSGDNTDIVAIDHLPEAEELRKATKEEWDSKYRPVIEQSIQRQIDVIKKSIDMIDEINVNDGIIKAPHMKQWLLREDGTKIQLNPSDTIYATKNKITTEKDDGSDVVPLEQEDKVSILQKRLGYAGNGINKDAQYYINMLRR